jgi:peptidoglycan-N-acetylglucosamine deacetylase
VRAWRVLGAAAAAGACAIVAGHAAAAGAPGDPVTPPPPQEYRALTTVAGASGTGGPLAIVRASFGQFGQDGFFAIRTEHGWQPSRLEGPSHSLCVVLFRGRRVIARICVAHPKRSDRPVLHYQPFAPDGQASSRPRALAAEILRRDDREIEARFSLAAAGLKTGRSYRWQATSSWTTRRGRCRRSAKRPQGCGAEVPNAPARVRFASTRLAGCELARPDLPQPIRSGPSAGRQVALTFDDGPAGATPQVLKILEREHVPATFFMVGIHIAPESKLVPRMLRDGDMVGNHSWDHANMAAGGPPAERELALTSEEIRRVSRFTPCLFRAPYGATSPKLLADVRARGMSAIQWNVDPRDWARPGTKAIERNVLSAVAPGSIVLMHDGGGNRAQTVAALPTIIRTLRARGYRFRTVTALLGIRLTYVR